MFLFFDFTKDINYSADLDIFELTLALVLDGTAWQDVEGVVLHDQEQSGIVGGAIVTTSGILFCNRKITLFFFNIVFKRMLMMKGDSNYL